MTCNLAQTHIWIAKYTRKICNFTQKYQTVEVKTAKKYIRGLLFVQRCKEMLIDSSPSSYAFMMQTSLRTVLFQRCYSSSPSFN